MQAPVCASRCRFAPQALSNEVGALLLFSAPLQLQTVRTALLHAQHAVDTSSHSSWPLPPLAWHAVALSSRIRDTTTPLPCRILSCREQLAGYTPCICRADLDNDIH